MNILFSTLLAAGVALAAPLIAQDRPVVVELFTSQGCSSCPPADEILAELSKRDDVIALALHVDYWDYIGWKDQFGNPDHAARQRAYAAAGGRKSVYTPEMIINGSTDIVGAKPMAVAQAIAAHKNDPLRVNLTLSRKGDSLAINAETVNGAKGPFTVHLLQYTPMEMTHIKRGENAGHAFEYHNIAKNWSVLGTWTADQPLILTAPLKGASPAVVIIQHSNAGPIVAAARVK
ncbi:MULTISPECIES: thioredoxin family protein [unclassified Sulfitobacter]|jgi:hypothetical protein|uniref:DUF1223 domain-containing protein n=1 Tax=unclassified Sulfitobacter TaxID=196795 RepID=UPI001594A19E|nr:DUF1223 domain-containing protein [Sulfitobacter sp. HGT1]